jgi:hypothetical protein
VACGILITYFHVRSQPQLFFDGTFFISRRDFFAETASFALQARRFDFMVGSSPKVIGYVFWR